MISVQQASVRFGEVAALDGIDLVVKPGERLVVLGPSGSGKSTLLRSIAGLQDLDAGSVSIDGVDVTTTPVHARGVGLMFQDGLLFPHLSVGDNIAYGLVMRGMPRRERELRVEQLLELVGLGGTVTADRRVTELSGGEQQRVALARSLAPEPRVLLLDEPFASLDPMLRGRLADDVRSLTEQLGMTVVAVTHDRTEAFAFADRIAVMERGQVIRCAAPEELWAQPESSLVARLVGMSVIERRVLTGQPSSDGAPDLVAVKPSGVTLVDEDHADVPDGAAAWRCTGLVETRAALGDAVRLAVLLDGGAAPDCRRLQVDVPADAAPVRGARVEAAVAADAVVGLQSAAG
jgi:thiamine transport system ATP-binding protein